MSTSTEALRGPSNAYYTRTPNPSNPGEYDPYYDTKYRDARPEKKRTSPWIKFGIPVLILLIIAGVVGGVLGTKLNKNKDKPTSSSSNGGGNGGSTSGGNSPGGGSNTNVGVFAVSTDSYYLPVYPTADNAQAYVAPTFTPTASATAAWPTDTFAPATPQATELRPNRPRIIAPSYKWAALPALIEKDPYLKSFNDHIIANATEYRGLPAVRYVMDGGSGILDVAREIKMRVKAFAYAYRMTNNTQWIDAAWRELAHAAGADTNNPWGGPADDPWNQGHFLDVAELTAAFAIAYDWLYDSWTPDQRGLLRDTIISHGLRPGLAALNGAAYGWWTGGAETASGNWNCVCNSGLTLGALAIMGDDTSGIAEQIVAATVPNANRNCVQGPSSDGTWRETPNYWYFGTTGHAEMTSALLTATGSDMGMLSSNPAFNLTALYHIYVFGMTSLFDYADHGPNKFSSTANSVMLYGSLYNIPMYQLYQRDHFDAASDPWNMFWYDPTVRGAWWNGLALDHAFTDPDTKWAAMRSSWTDNNGLYVAMKSSKLTGFQAHGDLDCGDFVLDAMGQRWAGELGSGDYLSTGYFNSENNDAQRWLYYRKRTEGQNTLMLGGANQVAQSADPTLEFESTGESQGSSPVISLAGSSTAYVRTDMSSAYGGGTTSVVRGVRLLNGRRQVLVQDDVSSGDAAVQWRMHTNATVAVNGGTATLTLKGKTLTMRLLSPSGTSFETAQPVRLASDPALPDGQVDQPNPGVTVVVVNVPAGQNSIQVLFDPQWDGMAAGDFVTPTSVPVGQWTLTSH